MSVKKPQPKFEAVIKKVGGLNKPIPLSGKLQAYMDSRFKEGQKVTITVKKFFRKRTTGKGEESNQNGYYWVVMLPILGEYFGYLPWEMNEALKNKFLPQANSKDPTLSIGGSTSELDTKEWEDFMEEVRTWALTEYEIKIPEPNEAE